LNQNPIENLFCNRQHDIQNSNPICYQFISLKTVALKTIVLNKLVASESKITNCEDNCNNLENFGHFLRTVAAENIQLKETETFENIESLVECQFRRIEESLSLSYVSDYTLKKIKFPENYECCQRFICVAITITSFVHNIQRTLIN